MSQEPVFNLTEALTRVESDEDLFQTLAELFIEQAPLDMAATQAALDAGDAKALARAAHRMKGAILQFAAPRLFEFTKELESLLIFGSYPEVASLSSFEEKIELLKEINSSYLYKDIFEFQGVKHPDVITRLLKALALQIGSEVSLNELSNILTIDKKTVERYIDLLEKNFVIFRLPPYTKNKRREISKLKKIFFYALGFRNAILQNFQFLDSRNDGGGLWENFMMVERLKYRAHHKIDANAYFWRTYDGQGVDLIEEQNGLLHGYEFKWKEPKRTKPPGAWAADNSNTYKIISPNQLAGFVL